MFHSTEELCSRGGNTENASGQITLSCPDHYERLVDGLWSFFRSNHATDLAYHGGRAHWLIAELFLSPAKLARTFNDKKHYGPELGLIVEFLYKGTVTVEQDQLEQLLETARKLEFTVLEDIVVAAFETEVPPASKGSKDKVKVKDKDKVTRRAFSDRKGKVSQQPEELNDDDIVDVQQPAGGDNDGGETSVAVAVPDLMTFDLSEVQQYERMYVTIEGVAEPVEIVLRTVEMMPESTEAAPEPAEGAREPVDAAPQLDECSTALVKAEADKLVGVMSVEELSDSNDGEPERGSESTTKDHTCHLCSRSFAKRGYLTSHLRTHQGIPRYECDVCGKAYIHRQSFNLHRRTHLAKSHACHLCDKAFSQAAHLSEHLALHAGHRNHSCSFCGKTFFRPSDLNKHALRHTQERRYQCDVCLKRFFNAQALRTHQMTHSREKRYSCDFCRKSFLLQHHLSAHLRTHKR